MSSIWTKDFWRAAAERAVKSAGQSAILAVGADQVNALTLDWVGIGGFALGGLTLSLLTSLASATATGDGPSVTGAEKLPLVSEVLGADTVEG